MKLKKQYLKIIFSWLLGIESSSLNRKVKFKDIFDKHYLG